MKIRNFIFVTALALLLIAGQSSAQFYIFQPQQGGTGTGSIPNLGDVLVGQGNGVYEPVATSTLGLAEAITAGDYLTRTVNDIDLDAEVVNGMKSFNIVTGSVISATNEIYQMKFARAVTINRISCSTDITGSTATIQGDERAEATPNTGGTDVMTSALVCDEDTEATTSFANASLAADAPLNFDIDAVAATAPSRLRVHVEFTVVDA
jgi:hypothetical protein